MNQRNSIDAATRGSARGGKDQGSVGTEATRVPREKGSGAQEAHWSAGKSAAL